MNSLSDGWLAVELERLESDFENWSEVLKGSFESLPDMDSPIEHLRRVESRAVTEFA